MEKSYGNTKKVTPRINSSLTPRVNSMEKLNEIEKRLTPRINSSLTPRNNNKFSNKTLIPKSTPRLNLATKRSLSKTSLRQSDTRLSQSVEYEESLASMPVKLNLSINENSILFKLLSLPAEEVNVTN
jgi:hypothetical protein